MLRKIALAATGALLLLAAPAARAQNANACWNRDLERIDYLANPPEHGDNTFFTTVVAQTGNVSLLYPAKKTLREFTQRLYRIRVDLGGATPTGCTNDYLNNRRNYFMPTSAAAPAGAANLQGLYSAAKTYPDPDTTYSGGGGVSDGFNSSKYYRYQLWPANDAGTPEDANTACNNALNAVGKNTGANVNACTSCLTTKGYWLNPFAADSDVSPAAAVFAGNRLNFDPPKWALLHLAYKRLVNGPLLSSLREAVVAMNGATGGTVVQKMLPQSCQGAGRPLNQKQAAIDGLTYTSTASPLSEMMFNTAWYMGGQQSPWIFGTGSSAAMANGKSGPCNGCNADFMVIFADGRSDAANPNCMLPAVGPVQAQCTATASCLTVGMGAEMDGDDYLDPAKYADVSAAITGLGVRQTPPGTCDMDFADDVSHWMSTHDVAIGTPGTKISTYVVAVGDTTNTYGEMTTLQEIAKAGGGGRFVVADDFGTLEANIEEVFLEIIRRATSFSVAAISTVQTRGSTFAFIPRFRPLEGAQWEGRLLRFNLFNEFAAGCGQSDLNNKTAANPNGNASCTDLYLRDLNGDFIGEDLDGSFVLLDTSKPYDGGWPIKTVTGPDGGTGTVAAVPIWEAASVLTARENAVIAGTSSDVRNIFTVAPDGGTYAPAAVPITVANVSKITPLLQTGGYRGDFCTELQGVTRHTYSKDDDCSTDVIRFLNGEDVMVQNTANRTFPPPSPMVSRPNILGDIFHSSPTLVQPPVEPFLCDFGVANQCLATLYNSSTPSSSQAYLDYQAGRFDGGVPNRDEFVLVGANDGMVHAFQAGTFHADAGVAGDFDLGTGRELWAFIPPDMMPKVQRYMLNTRHEILVDGTAMVRDIWVDGSGSTAADRKKQADEFHTIAIFGEREGGRHFFALDVSSPTNPKFLWSFPPPGTATSLEMGESWDDIAPSPPAVGPVAVFDANGPYQVNGKKASERWVFAFGGGFDPAFQRGRGIYVIDAWTGQRVYQYRQIDSTGASDPRASLWPVSAPVSLVDTDGDGLFDTLLAPDNIGQIWVLSLLDPGQDTNGDGLFDNWFGARAFIEQNGAALYHRHPFMQRAAVAKIGNPGAAGLSGTTGPIFRVLVGSGDRDQIKDGNGGTCGLANLGACLRKNCTVDVNQVSYDVGQAPLGHFFQGDWKYTAGGASITPQTYSADNNSQQSDCTSPANVEIDTSITCGGTTTTFSNTAYCDWGAGVDGGIECPDNSGRPLSTNVAYTPAVTMDSSRFYSFTLFDMSSASRKPFSTAAGATSFDSSQALTESNLVDVTTVNAGTNNALGWFVRHINTVTGQPNTPGDEKTSSSALVLGGCALWQTLLPNTAQTLTCGGTLPPDNGFAYQGDVATGSITCGATGGSSFVATVRSIRSDTIVAPTQATPVVSIGPSGQTMIGGVSLPVGAQPLQITLGVGLPRGDVHWLELTPQQHNCRHNGVGCAQ